MLDALIEPFINPQFFLSQQITSLVKFAHIACAQFIKHDSDFMTQHLYSDLQCMIKTAISRVAHTMLLNPNQDVFLCLLGDDMLETLFGRIRMLGGHSPNVDIDELRYRIASALRLDKIFQNYPEWERRPDRLKLTRSRHLDHLSPRCWQGDLRATSCDLLSCWKNGVVQAENYLKQYGAIGLKLDGTSVDFYEYFQSSKEFDLLRPKGGKYPGISAEVD